MPGTTTNQGIAYPVATDKVSDYPAAAKTAAETIDTALTAQVALCPNARFKTPPAGTVLRTFGVYLYVTTNQYGQAALPLPDAVTGIANCIVQSCQFDAADSNAFADVVTLTGVEASTGKPIITITRAGSRRANVSTYVSVIGIGW